MFQRCVFRDNWQQQNQRAKKKSDTPQHIPPIVIQAQCSQRPVLDSHHRNERFERHEHAEIGLPVFQHVDSSIQQDLLLCFGHP
ncbi:unnamed protein product [Larinioides sclopetarius]|uniref:Uncharacterized protein n=1 Tax=Larinioides sclopetarius TaxID=280406 RepID=A0AAV2BG19_9ARAC